MCIVLSRSVSTTSSVQKCKVQCRHTLRLSARTRHRSCGSTCTRVFRDWRGRRRDFGGWTLDRLFPRSPGEPRCHEVIDIGDDFPGVQYLDTFQARHSSCNNRLKRTAQYWIADLCKAYLRTLIQSVVLEYRR